MEKEFERVKYGKSPLAEVIFQVRFPNILRITSEEPSDFQDAIRQNYPMFSVNNNQTVVEVNGQKQQVGTTKNYQFISSDGLSKVNLTNSFVAFSTLNYDRWELFREECAKMIMVFNDIYKPTIIQRIGLRYKDVITRSKWNLDNTPFPELINKQYLGILSDIEEEQARMYTLDCEYLESNPVLAHRHFELIRTSQNLKELSFIIDCDYSVNQIMPYDVIMEMSEKLHESSSRFLRKAISEKLHFAMEPMPLV